MVPVLGRTPVSLQGIARQGLFLKGRGRADIFS